MRIKFVPRWQGAIQGHAFNRVRAFYPQLAIDHEFEDLMQEAFVVYAKCKARYFGDGSMRYLKNGKGGRFRRRVNNPRWFMALFARALHFRFLSLVHEVGRLDERPLSIDAMADGSIEHLLPEHARYSYDASEPWVVARMLADLPAEVLALLRQALIGTNEEARAAAEKIVALPKWMQRRIHARLTDGEILAGAEPFRRVLLQRDIPEPALI